MDINIRPLINERNNYITRATYKEYTAKRDIGHNSLSNMGLWKAYELYTIFATVLGGKRATFSALGRKFLHKDGEIGRVVKLDNKEDGMG
jgi:hypothetical protein